MPSKVTDDSLPFHSLIKLCDSEGRYHITLHPLKIYFSRISDIINELAVDNICEFCYEPPKNTGKNATSRDNAILFLIIIFLMILCSGGFINKNLWYQVCDGGYNW